MRDEDYRRFLENSCLRKQAYTEEAARATAAQRAEKTGLNISAYRCKVSRRLPEHWHIGRKHKNRQDAAEARGRPVSLSANSILTQMPEADKLALEKLIESLSKR